MSKGSYRRVTSDTSASRVVRRRAARARMVAATARSPAALRAKQGSERSIEAMRLSYGADISSDLETMPGRWASAIAKPFSIAAPLTAFGNDRSDGKGPAANPRRPEETHHMMIKKIKERKEKGSFLPVDLGSVRTRPADAPVAVPLTQHGATSRVDMGGLIHQAVLRKAGEGWSDKSIALYFQIPLPLVREHMGKGPAAQREHAPAQGPVPSIQRPKQRFIYEVPFAFVAKPAHEAVQEWEPLLARHVSPKASKMHSETLYIGDSRYTFVAAALQHRYELEQESARLSVAQPGSQKAYEMEKQRHPERFLEPAALEVIGRNSAGQSDKRISKEVSIPLPMVESYLQANNKVSIPEWRDPVTLTMLKGRVSIAPETGFVSIYKELHLETVVAAMPNETPMVTIEKQRHRTEAPGLQAGRAGENAFAPRNENRTPSPATKAVEIAASAAVFMTVFRTVPLTMAVPIGAGGFMNRDMAVLVKDVVRDPAPAAAPRVRVGVR